MGTTVYFGVSIGRLMFCFNKKNKNETKKKEEKNTEQSEGATKRVQKPGINDYYNRHKNGLKNCYKIPETVKNGYKHTNLLQTVTKMFLMFLAVTNRLQNCYTTAVAPSKQPLQQYMRDKHLFGDAVD